jgi:hypothetical protein
MVMLADPALPCAERLPEPAGLREELLALALDRPGAGAEVAERLGRVLADEWREELACAGVPAEALLAAAAGWPRELRLWVVGERRWQPTAESLFARALRRMASAA